MSAEARGALHDPPRAEEHGAVGPAELLEAAVARQDHEDEAMLWRHEGGDDGDDGEIDRDQQQPDAQDLAHQPGRPVGSHGDLPGQIGAAPELGGEDRELAAGQHEHDEAEVVRPEPTCEHRQDGEAQQLETELRRDHQRQVDPDDAPRHGRLPRAESRRNRRTSSQLREPTADTTLPAT